jgi:hypothetical protein
MAIVQLVNQNTIPGTESIVYDYKPSLPIVFTPTTPLRIRHVLDRQGDAVELCGLIAKTTLSPEVFFKRIETFKVIVGGQKLTTIPNCLLETVSTTKRSGDYINVRMDLSPFIGQINLIGLAFHEVFIEMDLLSCDTIEEIKFMTKNIYYKNHQTRQALFNSEQPIQFITGDESHNPQERYLVDIHEIHCKGYFIHGNIDALQRVVLNIGDQQRWNYPREILDFIGNRINHRLLYIPHSPNLDWKDRSTQSYVGAIGIFHTLELEFQAQQARIGVYTISHNVFRNMNGMGGLRFMTGAILIEAQERRIPSNSIPMRIWETKSKLIAPEKRLCPILYDNIADGGKYCECDSCKNCFDFTCLKTSLERSNQCPLCRAPWTSNIMYENRYA